MGFDAPVVPGGYAWWYVDGLSADGQHGLTIIGFIGSVFSPYYAWARRRGGGDPLAHCAVNVALYGRGGKRWTMTERGRGAVERGPDDLRIGPSALAWDGTALTIRLDEWTVPWPSRLRGSVRVHPHALPGLRFDLDAMGRHRWRPFAPCASIEVALDSPSLSWSGSAYLDINRGDEPLEAAFGTWDWSRTVGKEGTTIFYDVDRHSGGALPIALHIDRSGTAQPIVRPPAAPLPRSVWRLGRTTRSDEGTSARVLQRYEDGPFYARSLIAASIGGQPVTAVHETLSLDRFSRPWVQAMLPFRMPRALW